MHPAAAKFLNAPGLIVEKLKLGLRFFYHN